MMSERHIGQFSDFKFLIFSNVLRYLCVCLWKIFYILQYFVVSRENVEENLRADSVAALQDIYSDLVNISIFIHPLPPPSSLSIYIWSIYQFLYVEMSQNSVVNIFPANFT